MSNHWFVNVTELHNSLTGDDAFIVTRMFTNKLICVHVRSNGKLYTFKKEDQLEFVRKLEELNGTP